MSPASRSPVPLAPNPLQPFAREVREGLDDIWQVRVIRVAITSITPLKVRIDQTETLAVGIAGMTYTIGVAKGVAFQPRQGLPVVFPAA